MLNSLQRTSHVLLCGCAKNVRQRATTDLKVLPRKQMAIMLLIFGIPFVQCDFARAETIRITCPATVAKPSIGIPKATSATRHDFVVAASVYQRYIDSEYDYARCLEAELDRRDASRPSGASRSNEEMYLAWSIDKIDDERIALEDSFNGQSGLFHSIEKSRAERSGGTATSQDGVGVHWTTAASTGREAVTRSKVRARDFDHMADGGNAARAGTEALRLTTGIDLPVGRDGIDQIRDYVQDAGAATARWMWGDPAPRPTPSPSPAPQGGVQVRGPAEQNSHDESDGPRNGGDRGGRSGGGGGESRGEAAERRMDSFHGGGNARN
jgi:hypothetical protein